MNNLKKIFPNYILFLFSVFISGIVFFEFVRLILFLLNIPEIKDIPIKFILGAFFNRGILFDVVLSSFIISLPFFLLSINYLANIKNKFLPLVNKIYLMILYCVCIVISFSDIAYFRYYNSRMTKVVFNWFDSPKVVFDILFSTKSYYPFIILVILFCVGFIILINKIYKYCFVDEKIYKHGWIKKILFFLAGSCLVFLGIRGEYNPNQKPVQVEDAFYCKYAFMNQLGLNPVYNFICSFEDFDVRHFDDQKAIALSRGFLDIKDTKYNSPIARYVGFKEQPKKYNVVIVLVESLSAAKITRFVRRKN